MRARKADGGPGLEGKPSFGGEGRPTGLQGLADGVGVGYV